MAKYPGIFYSITLQLFPISNFEIYKWDKQKSLAILFSIAIVFAIIGFLFFAVKYY